MPRREYRVAALAGLVYAWIAFQVVRGDVFSAWDLVLIDTFQPHTHPELAHVFLFVTHLHGVPSLAAWTALLALGLFRAKQWSALVGLLLTVPGGMVLNVAMKHTFQRMRPVLEDPVLVLHTFSFPSGHAVGATLFYGFLTCYLWSRLKTPFARLAWTSLALGMMVWVSATRVYFGVHYLSDVLGGCALGIAWVAFCWALSHPATARTSASSNP